MERFASCRVDGDGGRSPPAGPALMLVESWEDGLIENE
jgi:hypothetical protein